MSSLVSDSGSNWRILLSERVKSGAEDAAVQTLRECRASALSAQPLDCGCFSAALGLAWKRSFGRGRTRD